MNMTYPTINSSSVGTTPEKVCEIRRDLREETINENPRVNRPMGVFDRFDLSALGYDYQRVLGL